MHRRRSRTWTGPLGMAAAELAEGGRQWQEAECCPAKCQKHLLESGPCRSAWASCTRSADVKMPAVRAGRKNRRHAAENKTRECCCLPARQAQSCPAPLVRTVSMRIGYVTDTRLAVLQSTPPTDLDKSTAMARSGSLDHVGSCACGERVQEEENLLHAVTSVRRLPGSAGARRQSSSALRRRRRRSQASRSAS